MTNDEAIAAEERKLEEAKAKAQEKIDAAIAKSQARLAELKAKSEERTTSRIEKLDELIAGALERVTKAQAYLDKLHAERHELVDGEQPELPVDEQVDDERTEQPALVEAGKRGRKSDAA
jgi:L-lactate utilization protein LutB